ncbi:MAG: hypothetical protein EBX37_14765, partial [Alphaproteobacteria bacterium]|nr:hypothetical protein [Alphaproteobacteria bacterium]
VNYYQSIIKLEEPKWLLHSADSSLKYQLLKVGINWKYSTENDWCKYKYYDELSILAYYQKDHVLANKAYKKLRYVLPSLHLSSTDIERICNNSQWFQADLNETYPEFVEAIKELDINTNKSFNSVPSILHLIYLKGYEFGIHHYICVASAVDVMKWNKVLIYNDIAPSNNEWWDKMLLLPNVQVVSIIPPTFINNHAIKYKAHQADVIRLVVLYHLGGVYHDLDMLTLRSYRSELLQVESNFRTVMMVREDQSKIGNMFIAACPKSVFIEAWIKAYETQYGTHPDWWGGLSVVKPHELAQIIPMIELETHTFLPFNYNHSEYLTSSTSSIDYSKSYGVHLWDTEQQKRNVLPKTVKDMRVTNSLFYQHFGKYVDDTMKKEFLFHKRSYLISVEGNIGSGKSTLLDDLKGVKFILPHVVLQEDVKGWTSFTDADGKNILEMYYQDKTKYSYCFQSLVLVSRIQQMVQTIEQNPNSIIITERCTMTDLMIFAKTLYQQKAMTEIEWQTYNQVYMLLTSMIHVNMDCIVYNVATPSVCMNRIAQRARKGEDL